MNKAFESSTASMDIPSPSFSNVAAIRSSTI